MSRRHISVATTFSLFLVFSGVALGNERPPLPTQIVEKMERLWKEREVEQLYGYVTSLEADFPGYVPAKCAALVLVYYAGGQSEYFVDGCNALRDELMRYPSHYPPRFRDVLESLIERIEKEAIFYEQMGLSAEERSEKFSMEAIPAKYDPGFMHLVEFAPMSSLPLQSGLPVVKHSKPSINEMNPDLSSLSLEGLQYRAMNEIQISKLEREVLVSSIAREPREVAIPILTEILVDSGSLASEEATSLLSSFGDDAISIFVDVLMNHLAGRRTEDSIYGLILLDKNTPGVRAALQRQIDDRSLYDDYAKEAIDYITRK